MDEENEKSLHRANGESFRDGRTDIVPSDTIKPKQILAIRVMRQLRYSGAISQLGIQAYAIVCYVAERLDESRYRGLIPLHNGQITDALGFGNWKILDKYRRAAVEAGWLIYQPQGNRQAGLYGVAIPADCMPDYMSEYMPNRQIDESIPNESTHNSTYNSTHNSAYPVLPNTYNLKPNLHSAEKVASQTGPKLGDNVSPNLGSATEVAAQGTAKGKKSKANKRLTEPNKPRDLDEIRAYIAELGLNHITAEEFWDGQEQRGWVSGRTPVKDWKAAIRVWNRNNEKRAPFKPQPPQKPGEYKRSHDGTVCPQPPKPMTGNRPPRNRDYSGVSQ